MKKGLIVVAVLVWMTTLSFGQQDTSHIKIYNRHTHKSIDIIFNTSFILADSFKMEIVKSAIDFQDAYGSIGDKIIIRDTIEFRDSIDETITLARTSNGEILLNIVAIDTSYNAEITLKLFLHLITHEYVHKISPLVETCVFYPYSQSANVIGYNGLCLQIYDGDFHFLSAMEDGVAEALFGELYGYDSLMTKNYVAIGSFMREIIKNKWITPKILVKALKTNNIPLVVRHILHKKKRLLKTSEVMYISNAFEEVYKTCEYKSKIEEIAQYRTRKLKKLPNQLNRTVNSNDNSVVKEIKK